MVISQLQTRYLTEEDRVLLRINTRVDEEFRFWFTQRFLVRLWPALRGRLYATPNVIQQQSKMDQQTVLQFEHENATKKAKFNTKFREAEDYPLGEAPLLVNKVDIKASGNGGINLELQWGEGQSLVLKLSADLLHLLCRLLEEAVEHSEWTFPALVPELQENATSSATRTLN